MSLNLFSRLSHYAPSEGEKRVRRPLEDFCTEALAFCLIKSVEFQKAFISDLLNLPDSLATHLLVDTQKYIAQGRVDLALKTVGESESEWLNVEVKIGAAIRDSQIQYAHIVLAPQAYFFRFSKECPVGVQQIWWERVHGILMDCLSDESIPKDEALRFVMRQFAEFLAEKGLKRIFMKTDAYAIDGIVSSAALLNEWTELLTALRNNLGLKKRGRPQPQWDPPTSTNKCAFYGIYGGISCYAGFEMNPCGSISCYYQKAFFGTSPKDTASFDIDLGEPGTVWVTARRRYPSGNEDKASDIQKIFSELQQGLRDFASKNKLKPHDPPQANSEDE